MLKIIERLSAFSICMVLSACQSTSTQMQSENPKDNKSNTSTISYRINCSLPKRDSFVKDANLYRFRLTDGDVGKCATDNKPYVGTNGFYKAYSERSEIVITQPTLRKNKEYNISFNHRVLKGYDNGDRNETLLQIKNCADSRVPVMAFLRRDAVRSKRFAFSLATGGDESQVWRLGSDKVGLAGDEWHFYEFIYSNNQPSTLQVKVDGVEVLPKTIFSNVGFCKGYDTVRIGNYRSGADKKLGRVNSTSISEYKNLEIREVTSSR